MLYNTKKARLCAISDAYVKKFSKAWFTIDEVATWAVKHNLYPVPTRGEPELFGTAWETRLDDAVAAEELTSRDQK